VRHGDISDAFAVQQVLARYCALVDDGQADELGEIFAPDAVMTIAGMASSLVRREGVTAIIEFIQERQKPEWRGKHILSIPRIECSGPEASAECDVLFVNRSASDGGLSVATTGRYSDVLRRQGDRWMITERSIVMY
jgi:ketosteroid isomerase-like protein